MSDEHVESLRYRLTADKSLGFDDPPPLERVTDLLRLRLEGDELTVWPKAHYASEGAAKEMVDGYVRAWEVSSSALLGWWTAPVAKGRSTWSVGSPPSGRYDGTPSSGAPARNRPEPSRPPPTRRPCGSGTSSTSRAASPYYPWR